MAVRRTARRLAVVVLGAYALLWLLGNGGILGASLLARATGARGAAPAAVTGVGHLERVDAGLWRGAAPTAEGYRQLAAAGVGTVVDLRPDPGAADRDAVVGAGMGFVSLPVEDGHVPNQAVVARVRELVDTSADPVFVHCSAGVGRTGSVVAAYRVGADGAEPTDALWRTLAVGPPSLEQVVWSARLGGDGHASNVPVAVTALSRALDAPRKLWGALT